MAKKLQLQIPTPCHENWENMTPTEKGRFCASCQKQVIDFSNKSDRDIAMFFKKPILSSSKGGSVCGRFMDDQLNREFEIPKKRIPWLKYFFQIAIPAFLASCDHRTQGKVKVADTFVQPERAKAITDQETCFTTTGVIMPEIVFENDTMVNGLITTEVILEDDADTTSQQKDLQQKSTILPELKLPASLEPPFSSTEINSTINNPSFISQSLEGFVGAVVIVPGDSVTQCYSKKPRKTAPLFQKIVKDSSFGNFRIYPNPIRSNSTLTIEWKQKYYGDHLLQLFNQSGQLMLSKDIYLDEKARLFTMEMPSIISGNYFLKLTGRATGKSYTEKLIVD
jgi:hypothetical protein